MIAGVDYSGRITHRNTDNKKEHIKNTRKFIKKFTFPNRTLTEL